jgi:hypothetical protein
MFLVRGQGTESVGKPLSWLRPTTSARLNFLWTRSLLLLCEPQHGLPVLIEAVHSLNMVTSRSLLLLCEPQHGLPVLIEAVHSLNMVTSRTRVFPSKLLS